MLKKLLVVAVATCLPLLANAEIWKDYTPSEQVTELVVVDVKSNYADDYLMQIRTTWVRSMEVQKEMGIIEDYGVWVANVSDSPNVFLTATYPNLGAMEGSEERYNAVTNALREMGMDDEEQDKMAKGYEDMREIVDRKVLRKITYK
jgi:hypothetical protein